MNGIVLVVDDSPENLSLIMNILENSGFTTLVSQSAKNALSILLDVDVDLVLLDALMPETNGFEMCTQMKQMPELCDIPVIFMTGLSEQKHIVQAFDVGSVDYIIKPIQPPELLARVQTHLKNARTTRSIYRAIDFSGHHFLAVNKQGKILWFTPQVPLILDDTLIAESSYLPEDILHWYQHCQIEPTIAEVCYKYPNKSKNINVNLIFMGQPEPEEFLIRLTVSKEGNEIASLQKRLNLTAREAEVLFWISKGKTNRDIAEILSISHRTVNKHLEQAYVKIGVENRASATARVLQALLV
ncbi:DNA-binding response regulator [Acetobacter oryzifermentans]|uniref:LuxR family transcriptional regulator n=1 Tax=Acetobacter oryzifermentans TaxID=1633874 RepID=A0ABN4NLJ4_9PROT|nr:response regulator [Acetobacter oryzifermentans]ANA12724.1 LuxR family transcriptional regulator [Acetobacter oryzifermentans]